MESPRKPSIGVMLIAVMAMLGSAVVLLLGLFMLTLPLWAPVPKTSETALPPAFFKVMMLLAAVIYIAPAIWGILTSIGLFRLKQWARISIIVFSVLLVFMAGLGGLTTLLIPIPTPPNQAADPAVTHGLRLFMGAFSFSLVSLGVWWLVFFNRAKVKQQFVRLPAVVGGAPSPEIAYSALAEPSMMKPRRPEPPLSFIVIAWLLLVGCLFVPLNLFLHAPAVLFAKIVTGWVAGVYFLALTAIQLYIGIGLLRLKPAARVVGVAYYLFFFLNMAVFYLAPGGRARMLDLLQRSQSMFPWMRAWPGQEAVFSFDITPFLWIGAIGGLIGILLPLYFLITRKAAFERAASASAGTAPMSG